MQLHPYPKREARKYDCGAAGLLTVREITQRTGRAEATIRSRIAAGIRGDALASNPPRRSAACRYREQSTVPGGTHGGMFVACRIARSLRSKDDIPSVRQLMERFGMSRATAYRWRAAWLAAMGLAHA